MTRPLTFYVEYAMTHLGDTDSQALSLLSTSDTDW